MDKQSTLASMCFPVVMAVAALTGCAEERAPGAATIPAEETEVADYFEDYVTDSDSQASRRSSTDATGKPPTKGEILRHIANETGLSDSEVDSVLASLTGLIEQNVGPDGPGIFVLPSLLKMKVVKKPATAERVGVNPFTGEKMIFKAKPARKYIKITALKRLKEMI